jgi:hypothetical protein
MIFILGLWEQPDPLSCAWIAPLCVSVERAYNRDVRKQQVTPADQVQQPA